MPLSFSANRPERNRRAVVSFCPRVEVLEERCVPANTFFRVPGAVGTTGTFRFDWTKRDAGFDNEVGVYVIDDASGRVNGVRPGDPRYLRAVMRSASRQVLFDSSSSAGNFRTLSFTAGTRLGFYLIQDMTSAELLKTNPTNSSTGGKMAFFSFSAANPDRLEHVRTSDAPNGGTRFAWEDLFGLGDADFNDVVFNVRRVGDGEVNSNFQGRALATPGRPGQLVRSTFSILRRNANLTGEVGVFQVDSADGRIGTLKPGDPGYAAAALARRTTVFNANQSAGATNSLDLLGGSLYGIYLIRNGTAQQALAGQAQPLFSFLDANPGEADLMRQFRDTQFGFETGGEKDYKDLLVNVQFDAPREARETTPPTLTARLRNDTGVSSTDGITSDPTVIGQVTDASGIRSLRAGFDNTPSSAFRDITNTIQPDGTFILDALQLATLFGGILPQGNRVLHLEATDNVGNVSRFDLAFNFDQTAPTITFDLAPEFDTTPVGDQITQFDTVTLRAVTTPGLTVRLVQTGAEVVAGTDGVALFTGVALTSGANDFTMVATDLAGNQGISRRVITRNDAPTVAAPISDQALDGTTTSTTIDLDTIFADLNIVNSIARFNTNFGEFNVELFDASATGVTPRAGDTARTTPGHVANFIQYAETTDTTRSYNDTIVHRNAKTGANQPFVIQGGGFELNPNNFPTALNTFGNVTNEPGNSNVRGTIALARQGGAVNSGTSQWFINLGDNSFLDTVDQGFTVFGRVTGSGMAVVDAIANTPTFNVIDEFPTTNTSRSAFGELPLQNFPSATAFPEQAGRDNYVVVNNVSIIQRMDVLTYSVQSVDPTGVVQATINSSTGVLTLTRVGDGPSVPTNVTITIRATDSHGAFVEDAFTVTVS